MSQRDRQISATREHVALSAWSAWNTNHCRRLRFEPLESRYCLSTLIPVTTHRDLVFDPVANRLYITTSTGTVERFDVASQTLLTPLAVGTSLRGADITADGQFLYVAENQATVTQGFIHKVNLNSGAVTDIPYSRVSLEQGAWDVSLGANGMGFVTTQFSGSGSVPLHQLDLATDTLTARSGAHATVQQNTHVERGADRSLLIFAESNISSGPIFTFNSATNSFPQGANTFSTLSNSLTAISRAGAMIALELGSSVSILGADLSAVRTLSGVDGGLAFDPARDILYAVNPTTNEIVAFDTGNWGERFRLPIGEDVGSSTPQGNGVLAVGSTQLFLATTQGIRAIPLPTNPGVASRIEVGGFPRFVKTGVEGSLTLTVKDSWGDVVTNFAGTIHFTSSDAAASLPPDYSFLPTDGGTKTFPATLNTLGTQNLGVAVVGAPLLSALQSNITVHAAGAALIPVTNHRDLLFDAAQQTLYITTSSGALERYHLPSETLRPPLAVGTSLNGADLSPDGSTLYVAEGAVAGLQGFVHKVTLASGAVTALPYTRQGLESGAWDVSLASNGLGFVTTQFAGSGNNPLRQLDLTTGALSVRSDHAAVRQNTHVQRGADRSLLFFQESNASNGPIFTYGSEVNSFPASFNTQSFQDSVSSAVNRNGSLIAYETGSAVSIVTPSLTAVQTLSGLTGGIAFDPSRDLLYAVDATANELVAYSTSTWQVKFKLPIGEDVGTSTPLANGVMTVSDTHVFLATAQGIRVIPLPTNPGVASRLEVTGFPEFVKSGVTAAVNVAVKDAWGDLITNYTGTVHLSSTDPSASLPVDYTFTPADGGTKSFAAGLITPGTQSITVAATTLPALSGTQAGIAVHAAGAALIPITTHRDLVFDTAQQLLYVTTSTGRVERYHLPTETLLTPLLVGSDLYGADLTADGSALYVAEGQSTGTQGLVRKVNLSSGAVTNIAYTPDLGESGTWDVSLAADGLGFVTTQFAGSGSNPLRQLNLATDALTPRSGAHDTVQQNTHVQRGADRSLLFFQESNISSGPIFTYSSATGAFPVSFDTDTFQDGSLSAVNRNGSLVAFELGSVVSIVTANLQAVRTISGMGGGLAFDSVRDLLYAVNPTTNEVVAFGTTNWQEKFRLPIGEDVGISSPMASGVLAAGDTHLFLATAQGIRAIPLPTNPGVAARVEVAGFPTFIKSGVGGTLSVAIKDGWGDLVANYTGTVRFSSTDAAAGLPPDYTFTLADGGTKTFSASLNTPGTQSITVADVAAPALTGAQAGIAAHAAGAALIPVTTRRDLVFDAAQQTLLITTSTGTVERYHVPSETLRTPFSVGTSLLGADITADGSSLYVAEGQSTGTQGLVHKLNLNTGAVSDLAYTLEFGELGAYDVSLGSNGRGFVTTSFGGSGTTPLHQLNLATDTLTNASHSDVHASSQGGTSVQRGADRSRLFFLEPNVSSGPLFTYTSANHGFSSTVNAGGYFDDKQSAVNRNGSLIAYEGGVGVTILDANLYDARSLRGVDGGLAFDPIRDILYAVDATANEVVAFDTLTWRERFRLPIGEDVGPSESLDDGVLVVGDAQLFLATNQGIRVIPLPANPGIAARIDVTDYPSYIRSSASSPLIVTIRDAWGDVVPDFVGTVHFTSSDPAAALPADYTFSSADGGTKTLTATFGTIGTHSITVTSTGAPSLTGQQVGIAVHAPGASLIPIADARDLVFNTAQQTLYVTTGTGAVERYHLPTESLRTPWVVGSTLWGADVTPDGNWLYVGEGDSTGKRGVVHKVNLSNGMHTDLAYTATIGSNTGVWDVSLGSGGLGFVSTFLGGGSTALYELNLATDVLTQRSGAHSTVGQETNVQRGPDRSLLVFQEANTFSGPVFTYSSASNTFPSSISTQTSLDEALSAVNRNASLIALEVNSAVRVTDASLNTVQTLNNANGGLVFDPLRDVLYVASTITDTITAYDTTTWSPLFQMGIGEDVFQGSSMLSGVMAISDDATALFLSTTSGVRLYDLAPRLSVTVPASISEVATSATGTVTRNNVGTSQPLVVTLTSADVTAATVPTTVTIPANQLSATFPISPIDDLVPDGIQTTTITAAAAGLRDASAVLSVTNFNHWPTIGGLVASQTPEDVPLTLAFTIGDLETPPSALMLTVSSNNQALVPNANLLLGGSGANRTITVTPAANLSGSATISLSVSDGETTIGGGFALTVNSVNDPPSDITLSNATIAENVVAGIIGSVSAIDIDSTALQFFVSDSRFEVIVGYLRLKSLQSLNFEAEPSVNLTLRVRDSGGLELTKPFTITVTNVNEAPTGISLVGGSVVENSSGAVVGTISAADPDAGDSHAWQVSDSRFEIALSQLRLKAGQSLDRETEPSVNLTITAQDLGGLSFARPFTVTVANANEPPTDVSLTGNTVVEVAAGAVIGTVSVTDVDAGDSHSFLVSDNRLEVVAGQLRLKVGQSFNFEAEPSVNATITARDAGGLEIAKTFTLAVTGVNEPPTSITLAASTVAENAAGVAIGAVSAVDPDAGDSHLFVVSDSRFEIVAGQLQLTAGQSLNFETEPSVNLTITARDAGGLELVRPFSMIVTNVNEPPTNVMLAASSVAENAADAMIGAVTESDPDGGDSHVFLVSDSRFEVAAGQLRLTAGQSLDFETEPSVNLTITARDAGGLELVKPFTLTVTNVNEVPTNVMLTGSSVAENAVGAAIGNVSVTDIDAGDSHTLSANDDRFEIVGGQLRLKAGQSLDFEAEQSVNLTVTSRDAGLLELVKPFTLTVTNVNEAPTSLSLAGNSVAENAVGAVIGTVTAADPDAADTLSLLVSDSRFEVVGGQLRLKPGPSLDFETEPIIGLMITARDALGLAITRVFTIGVTDANDPPASMMISNHEVKERISGQTIANLSAADEDVGQTLVYSVDDPRFEVNGSVLMLKAGEYLNRTAGVTVSLEITATDNGVPPRALTQTVVLNVLANPFPWQNPADPLAASYDPGHAVGPLDALVIFNLLNNPGTPIDSFSRLPAARPAGSELPFYDTNGDGYATSLDALLIINHLNAEGEGESASSPPVHSADFESALAAIAADVWLAPRAASRRRSPART